MKNTISAKNCRIEIIDHIESENVIFNIFYNTGEAGEYDQIVISRNKAKAFAYILLGDN